jgi:2'-5' RNA ligase
VTREGSLRNFFADELDDASRRAAHAVAGNLAAAPGGDAVRWLRPESYHVTLRFLGTTPRDRVAAVADAARRATRAIAPFSLQLGALAGLPPRRPRAVVLDLAPHDAIDALARQVERAVVEAGFAPEERAFHPHLTLGRVRERQRYAPFLDPADGPGDVTPFAVDSFVLFQSVLGSGGAQYTPLERVALARPKAAQ